MALDRLLAASASAVQLLCRDADEVEALRGLSAEQTLELARGLGELARVVDSLGAVVSSEITHRVQTDAAFRRTALGGEVGGRAASELVRELTRLDDDTVRSWQTVGDAIAPRTTLRGDPLPSVHPAIADAVLGASITAGRAAIVATGIDRLADRAEPDRLCGIETTLVEYAASLTTRELHKLVRRLHDRVDPDGAEPREEWLRAHSALSIRQLPNGLTRITADLHPEAAGFVRTALDAQTAPRRVSFSEAPAEADEVVADTRPLAQKRVDALQTMARDFLAHDTGTMAGTAVTMLVTVPLETLQTGIGTASIAGVEEPIGAGTARRLAAQAEIVPAVLGTGSEPLDLGRCARLFSEAQRRALALRDEGCIWPGCEAPPGWCEVAHVLAWILGGETDLDNAALMCPHHHRRFDHDGWQLIRDDGTPYLIPPPWLDPTRTPRRAGRLPALAGV